MTELEALKIAFGWYKDLELPGDPMPDHDAARIIRRMYQARKAALATDPDRNARDPYSPFYDPE